MMKVKFIESVTVPAGEDPEFIFKKGSVHDLREDQAWRWIRRNKAFPFVEGPKLKVGRPMMGISAADMGEAVESREFKAAEVVADIAAIVKPAKPKKVGRPKKRA